MRKSIFKFLFLLITLFLIMPTANAVAAIEVTDDIIVKEDTDATSAYFGSNIKVQSNIAGILFAGGSSVEVTKNNDYAFIGGMDIKINMITANDLFVGGDRVTFDKNTVIGRDSHIGGNSLNIAGTFNRDAQIYGDIVVIENTIINGNVKIMANELTIKDSVKVIGKISINDNAKLNISPSANLANKEFYEVNVDALTTFELIKEKVFALMGLILLFIVTNAVFPKLYGSILNNLVDTKFNDYVSLSGIGFISMIIIPILAIMAMFSGIGFAIGLIITLLFVGFITLSNVIIGYLIGEKFIRKQFPKLNNDVLINVLGITLLFILTELPIFGGTIKFAVVLISLGLITKTIRRSRKEI